METTDQIGHLRALGCDMAQGCFFARPQPAEVIEGLLEENDRVRLELT